MPKSEMQSLREDIQQIDQKVSLVSYNVNSLKDELGDKIDRLNRTLDGDKDHYIEGVIAKVERHEATIKTVNTVLANAKAFWTILGVLGVSSIASLLELIQKVFAK